MLIRKNTKAFKTILEIITACKDRPDREKLIRLYITKAGHTIDDRISIEGIQGDAALFYEMNYYAVLGNLESPNRQLQQSDDSPGIYFFHSTGSKGWDETPFEFDEAVKKEFASLSDLPVVRKKEKAGKFVLPVSNHKAELNPVKKEKTETKKAAKVVDKGPKQPDYQLKHKIQFTHLEEVVFRKPQLTKKDVLDYYNKVAEYILPYLKDRPQSIRVRSKNGRHTEYKTAEALAEHVQLPAWLQTVPSRKKDQGRMLLCNDKNHLLFYGELGCVEFAGDHSRMKSHGMPDYLIVRIDSLRGELNKAIEAAGVAHAILSGLRLPSFVKTDGQSGFHIYVPLDAKSSFEASKSAAAYICKLIRLKVPELVTLEGSDDHSYGKLTLDYSLNEPGVPIVAPYSLVTGESPMVAAPLSWEEVRHGLQLEDFNFETIFKRLKQEGDPFENIFKKKVNADSLLERLELNYAFLFN